jgi:hypothetical protein
MAFRDKLKALIEEYGPIALVTYFVLFGLVLAGAFIAIRLGFSPEGTAGTAGTLGAAWLFAKVTQPIRFGVTLALTPLVAKVWRHFRPKPTPP